MKTFLATICLMSMSLTAAAGVQYNRFGMAVVPGTATLTLTQANENEGTVSIGGEAAQAIWNGMTKVTVTPADQFQPNERKTGQGITCDKAVSDDIDGMKKGDVLCFIFISDRSQGKL